MRYLVALVVAFLVIAGGVLYARWTVSDIESRIQDRIAEQQRAGTLPPDATISDVGVQLPGAEMRQFTLARWVLECWFIWTPVVVALCLGLAAVVKRTGERVRQ